MIDYVETTIALQTGKKKLDDLLLKRKFKDAKEQCNELIIALIDLKFWLDKQNENN
jgi:hypothetical protein